MPHLSFGGLGAVLDLGEKLRFHPYASTGYPLADVRRQATLEGYCYPHVQAIIVAIDQYAEAAIGNREYFLNRPYRIG
jgi:hypothetical protein